MVEICDICGREVQNKQALKIHKLSCEKDNKLVDDDIESIDDLEIKEEKLDFPEETKEKNFCPECNFELKDYETPCSNCNAEIVWGD